MTTPRKIRWLIAHQPEELFVRTARAFSQELAQRCGDELEVEILTPPDYVAKYGELEAMKDLSDGLLPGPDQYKNIHKFWKHFTDGAFEMCQMQVSWVGEFDPDFKVFDLPYLFDSHEHVSRVVDGPIGRAMCEQLSKQSAARGLAFTYSGGWRVIGSNTAITSIQDLQNMRVVVQNKFSIGTALDSIGVQTMMVPPTVWQKNDAVSSGLADAVETTYLRWQGEHVFKTNHSMFMTTILVTNEFWSSLTSSQQQAFQMAASEAAAIERAWALEDAADYEANAIQQGVSIVEMNDEDTTLLKKKSQLAYIRSHSLFSKGLVAKIKTA